MRLGVCIFFTALIFVDVVGFVDASRQGLALFHESVLPVLFPFFFITSLAAHSGVRGGLGIGLFSMLGGYPTSARMISQVYDQGQITKERAKWLSTMTSFPSPIFIIATVGVSLFSSLRFGLVIFLAILIGALLNGLLWRRVNDLANSPRKTDLSQSEKPGFTDAFANSLQSSVQSILMVGGLIVLFFIVGSQLDSLLGLPVGLDIAISSGLEMTSGVFKLAGITLGEFWQVMLVTAILAWGGICVGMQGLLFFKKFGMSVWFYLAFKLTHTLLAVSVASFLFFIF